MKAVGYFNPLPIDHPEALVDLDLPAPTPGPRDLLVEVRGHRHVSLWPLNTRRTPTPRSSVEPQRHRRPARCGPPEVAANCSYR